MLYVLYGKISKVDLIILEGLLSKFKIIYKLIKVSDKTEKINIDSNGKILYVGNKTKNKSKILSKIEDLGIKEYIHLSPPTKMLNNEKDKYEYVDTLIKIKDSQETIDIINLFPKIKEIFKLLKDKNFVTVETSDGVSFNISEDENSKNNISTSELALLYLAKDMFNIKHFNVFREGIKDGRTN